jgi:hypothetical protein
MAKKIYDLAVKTGEYKNQSGEMKGRWQNVGAVMQSDDGSKFIMMARWFNPAGVQDLSGKGGESVLLSMFPPRDPNQQQGQQGQQGQQQQSYKSAPPQSAPNLDDDIPF